MMNAADSTLPTQTAQMVSRCTRRGSLSQPNSHSPRNVDSRKNAASPSIASGAPKTLPTSREYAPQFIPNWNSCTSPVTTPDRHVDHQQRAEEPGQPQVIIRFLLRCHAVCSSAVRNASPIVIGTKKKWFTDVQRELKSRQVDRVICGFPVLVCGSAAAEHHWPVTLSLVGPLAGASPRSGWFRRRVGASRPVLTPNRGCPAGRTGGDSGTVSEHYDVIIIGSGAGRGHAGAHPRRAPGKRILLLERGDFLPREMDNWDPRPVFVDGKYISKDTWYDGDGKPFQPQVHYFVGGATKMYGAALYRLRPQDFGEIRHVDGISPAWPLGYDDFEPWYSPGRAAVPGARQRRRGPDRGPPQPALPVARGLP